MRDADRWVSDPIVQHALSRLAATRDSLIASPDSNPITTNLERDVQALECGVAILRHAATLEGAQRVAGRLRAGSVLECKVEVEDWNRMFKPMKASGSRTPSATGSPEEWGPILKRARTPSVTGTPKAAEKVGARSEAVCEQCGIRDGFQCVVTGLGYRTLAQAHLSAEAYQNWKTHISGGIGTGPCHVAHIIPFCMSKEKYHPVLDYFDLLSGLSLSTLTGTGDDGMNAIDSLQNVMMLSTNMHQLLGCFSVENEHVFEVEFDSDGEGTAEVKKILGSGTASTSVRFDSTPNGVDPPSREVLKLYESLYDIAHASPGTEALLLPVLRLEPDEWETDCQDWLDGEETLEILQSKLEWVAHAEGRSIGS